jgi:hypothetical protein
LFHFLATHFYTEAKTTDSRAVLWTGSEKGTSAMVAVAHISFCVSRRRQLLGRDAGITSSRKTTETDAAKVISLPKFASSFPGGLSRCLSTVVFIAIFNTGAASSLAESSAPGRPYSLSIEIYAGLTNGDQSMSQPFLQQLMAFSDGTGPAPAELGRILHLEHPAAPEFDLVGEGTADGQSRSVRVHVTQKPDGRLFLQFSDLGGPSQSFFSHNQLLIGPGQREFLRFQDTPAADGKVLTSVVLVTTSKQ